MSEFADFLDALASNKPANLTMTVAAIKNTAKELRNLVQQAKDMMKAFLRTSDGAAAHGSTENEAGEKARVAGTKKQKIGSAAAGTARAAFASSSSGSAAPLSLDASGSASGATASGGPAFASAAGPDDLHTATDAENGISSARFHVIGARMDKLRGDLVGAREAFDNAKDALHAAFRQVEESGRQVSRIEGMLAALQWVRDPGAAHQGGSAANAGGGSVGSSPSQARARGQRRRQ